MPDGSNDPSARMRTPLLALITQESLERDYQMVARRGPRKQGRWGVVAVVVVFGLLLTIAAVQTNANAETDSASRDSLIERIDVRREAVQRLTGEISRMRESNADAEDRLLVIGDRVNDVEGEAADLGAVAGYTAVVGPGIRIELDNAPYADPETEHIRDSDLALLVNALWSAGAEAISVNGQRLSARTAIRNSGTAIEVNSIGIAPPYVVQAIGNPDTLASRVVETSSGGAFALLAGDYGWLYEVDNEDELRLPGAPARLRQLRSALPVSTDGRQPKGDE